MSLLSRSNAKQVSEFAEALAEAVAKRYPPAMDKAERRRVSANRLTKILEDAFERAAEFQREKSLGWYRKASLGNDFRWKLKELGYSEAFIDIATEGLIVYISRTPDKDAKA